MDPAGGLGSGSAQSEILFPVVPLMHFKKECHRLPHKPIPPKTQCMPTIITYPRTLFPQGPCINRHKNQNPRDLKSTVRVRFGIQDSKDRRWVGLRGSGFNIGALIITNTIMVVSYDIHSIMAPKPDSNFFSPYNKALRLLLI